MARRRALQAGSSDKISGRNQAENEVNTEHNGEVFPFMVPDTVN